MSTDTLILCGSETEAERLALRDFAAICPPPDASAPTLAMHRCKTVYVTPTAARERRGVAFQLHVMSCDVRVLPAGFDVAVDDPFSASTTPLVAKGNGEAVDELEIIRGDDLDVERVRWLWSNYLPAGKLTLIAGPAGVSKTTLALAVAATITQGGRWPDGTRAEAGSVLIWSGEDGIADTLLPRLIARGAERSRVHFVGEVVENGERHAFDPSIDMERLLLAALRIDDLRLVMIDPVILTVRGDSNTNGDVRRGLYPLQKLAETTGAAVIGITHFSKNTSGKHPVERVTGSLAFAAAARVVLAVARMPDDQGGGRLVVRAKNNLGPDGGGFRFDLRMVDVAGAETVAIAWGEAITGSAMDVLATAEAKDDPEDHDGISEATEFLREVLQEAGGSMERKEVMAAAKAAGHYERRIDRAKARLKLAVETTGFGKARRSVWSIARP